MLGANVDFGGSETPTSIRIHRSFENSVFKNMAFDYRIAVQDK